jgi:hypothetical protein
MVIHACNPSTKIEAGGLQVQGQHRLKKPQKFI